MINSESSFSNFWTPGQLAIGVSSITGVGYLVGLGFLTIGLDENLLPLFIAFALLGTPIVAIGTAIIVNNTIENPPRFFRSKPQVEEKNDEELTENPILSV